MELNAILEAGDEAKRNIWYALCPEGEAPSSRVGHGCVVCPCHNDREKHDHDSEKTDSVIIVAGANPGELLKDCFKLSFDGLMERYEHACFYSKNKVFVFGGANTTGNLVSMQILKLVSGTGKWTALKQPNREDVPSSRTCNSCATVDNKMFLFSGGLSGPDAVTDVRLHRFNADDEQWDQPVTTGIPPAPRQGHAMVSIGNMIYVHGGMNGDSFYNDIYQIDRDSMNWAVLHTKGDVPSARASHGVSAHNNRLFVFGGLGQEGPLNDLYYLEIESLQWSKIEPLMCVPPPRLDHSMVCITLPYDTEQSKQEDDSKFRHDEPKLQNLLMVFGGMDASGQLFNDCFVIRIDS